MTTYVHPYTQAANAWWNSLSINEMRTLADKYHYPLGYHHVSKVPSRIIETYAGVHNLPMIVGTYK